MRPTWGALWTTFLLISTVRAAGVGTQPSPAPSTSEMQEFTDEFERDFNLRSVGLIQLTNLRGNIVIQGWSQDRIRVLAHRRVYAESETAAKAAFSAMDFRFDEKGGNIECSAQYGRGLDIRQRVEERGRPVEFQSKMDMVVFAPSRLKLKVWTDAGSVSLKGWNNTAELRTLSGDISAESVKGPKITSLCQNCSAKFRAIQGSIRAITDGGNLSLRDVEGSDVFLESAAGNISAQKVHAQQLYVTKSGNVSARDLRGHVEFQTQEGSVEIASMRGFASGKSGSGSIRVHADEWEFDDKALIESTSGDISVSLPKDFAAEVDLRSAHGKIQCAFPVRRAAGPPLQAGHLAGRIGEETTDLLKVFSDSGNVEILRLLR